MEEERCHNTFLCELLLLKNMPVLVARAFRDEFDKVKMKESGLGWEGFEWRPALNLSMLYRLQVE